MVESPLITNQQRENLFELQQTLIDLKSTQKKTNILNTLNAIALRFQQHKKFLDQCNNNNI